MQPKTIEDYRDLTKVLKLKIVKQSKIIQQLQAKCRNYQDDINNATLKQTPHDQDPFISTKKENDFPQIKQQLLSSLQGKTKIMNKFLKGTKIYGITPQSIFRIADQNYTQSIQSDFFRTVLSKISLNLTAKQISCLIWILDENCLGYINKQEYQNSLYAYQISLQGNCLTYKQECLLKLCSLFNNDRIDLNKFYEEMKTISNNKTNGKVNLIVFQEQTRKYFNGKLKQKQIVGAYNLINLQKQVSIDKKNFLYGVNSFMNRLFNQERYKTDFTQVNNLKNSRSQIKVPSKNLQNISLNVPTNVSGFQQIHRQDITKDSHVNIVELILKKKKLTFNDLINSIIQKKFKGRLGSRQFKKCLQTISRQFTPQQIVQIFKTIDLNQDGSLDIFSFINFTLIQYKDPNMVLKLIGKSFQIFQISAIQFWQQQQYTDFTSVISKDKFLTLMANAFQSQSSQIWGVLWKYFDKGKGTITIQSIIDVFKKYSIQSY